MKLNIYCCFFSKTTKVEKFDTITQVDSMQNFDRPTYIEAQELRKKSIENIDKSRKLQKLYNKEEQGKIRLEGSAVKYLQEELIENNIPTMSLN